MVWSSDIEKANSMRPQRSSKDNNKWVFLYILGIGSVILFSCTYLNG